MAARRRTTQADLSRWARRGTTTQRGLGSRHQALKRTLLATLVDGTPCLEPTATGRPCAQPMWHPNRCPWQPDGRPDGRCPACRLDLCHDVARALGGDLTGAGLGHATCNRAAGARLRNAMARRVTVTRSPLPRW